MKEFTLVEMGRKIFGMVIVVTILVFLLLFILSEWHQTSNLFKAYPVIFILSASNVAFAILLKSKWTKLCYTYINERRQIEKNIKELDGLKNKEKELKIREEYLKIQVEENDKREEQIKEILSSPQPLKVISTLYSDVLSSLFCDSLADYFTYKPRPALKAAQNVRRMKQEFQIELTRYKIFQYKFETIESLYPEVSELFEDDNIDESLTPSPSVEVVRKWADKCTVTDEDERAQYFLNCYMASHNKTKWEIGRDYETFVAYQFFKQKNADGTPMYKIIQEGANKKLEDRGRDVIAINKETGKIFICQCKMWAKDKTIFEKHIFQLYGSTLDYVIRNNLSLDRVEPVFITTIKLSKYAKKCAELLGVTIRENFEMGEYAPIKLNINETTNEKIYHLPFDQQYDNVKIEKEGEGYAKTVAEAVKLGFRRAHRYSFNNCNC